MPISLKGTKSEDSRPTIERQRRINPITMHKFFKKFYNAHQIQDGNSIELHNSAVHKHMQIIFSFTHFTYNYLVKLLLNVPSPNFYKSFYAIY